MKKLLAILSLAILSTSVAYAASGTLEYPVFDMYGAGGDDELYTFHEREIATYSPATTIVLNSRGIKPKLTLTKMATKSKTLNRSIKK
jgi:hypothetical protein